MSGGRIFSEETELPTKCGSLLIIKSTLHKKEGKKKIEVKDAEGRIYLLQEEDVSSILKKAVRKYVYFCSFIVKSNDLRKAFREIFSWFRARRKEFASFANRGKMRRALRKYERCQACSW